MLTYRLRQQGIVTRQQLARLGTFVQIGAGGIGSAAALALGKLGVAEMTIYDHDTLEVHNIGNQFLPETFIGKPKVHALAALMTVMAPDARFVMTSEKWHGQCFGQVMIVAVDSMATRQMIFEAVVAQGDCEILIDARMGAETLRLYTIALTDPEQATFYARTLYPDAEAVQEPCSARGIVYTSMFAGAHIANTVRRLATHLPVKREQIHLIALNQLLGQ